MNQLSTNRLLIRKLKIEDAPSLFAIRSHLTVKQFQPWDPGDVNEIETFIQEQSNLEINQSGSWFQLGITLKNSGQFIGDCGLHFLEEDDYQVEIGITLSPDYQGKGYATEALTAILDFLFNSLEKHRVVARTAVNNHQSIKLLKRVGMRLEGHFRESQLFKGKWVDDLIFAILKREWQNYF